MKNIAQTLLASVFTLLLCTGSLQAQQLQSPAEFLGYELGERFSLHHQVVDYYRHVAEHSDRVELKTYGESYEHRPLMAAFITAPDDIEQLDRIRANNLRLAGLKDGEPEGPQKAITWLSYNIHGDESSSMEAAMKTLYELASSDTGDVAQWLEQSVVVLDPAVNPDGRDRYATWFNQAVGKHSDPRPETREHNQPWPGGRFNHYLFDLNRDWAWQTQQESRFRGKLYTSWLPHVHVDFHEMGYNSPYYFAPAADPLHEDITDWQYEFQTEIGKNNTARFDETNRLYYTREVFDLKYPSYGDTWPTFQGAIGMTYEQAGGGSAGRAVITSEGDTLTLERRLTNHHTTGMATIQTTAENRDRVLDEFQAYYDQAVNDPPGEYRTYIIKGDNNDDDLAALAELLDRQDIAYGASPGERHIEGYDYRRGERGQTTVSENDLLVSAHQPKSVMAKVLLEPRTEIVDSLTYDITAWSLPYAYGLEAYATEERIDPHPAGPDLDREGGVQGDTDAPYAYIARWQSKEDMQFLVSLLNRDIRVRFAGLPFTQDGKEYEAGTLVITRRGNEQHGEAFDRIIREHAEKHDRTVTATQTGFVEEGIDFGSNNMHHIDTPRVAALSGDGVSPTSFGEVWHFFDRQIGYPMADLETENLSGSVLKDYDVLVMPGGWYSGVLEGNTYSDLVDWVRGGGTLIALGSTSVLEGREEFGFLSYKNDQEDEEPEDMQERLRRYGDREREAAEDAVRGSIFRVQMDETHPLGFGYDRDYFTLTNNASALQYMDSGWNVGVVREGAHRAGFTGHQALPGLEESLVFGVHSMGSGQVVIMDDNPLFRAFWRSGKLLMGNAVFFIGGR